MSPGTNSSLYVALGSAAVIVVVAIGVRAISPPSAKAAGASSNTPFLSVNGRGGQPGMPPGAPSPGAPYRVEEAVPIQLGGQTGLAVRFSGEGLDAAGKETAARDIFRRMQQDAEAAGVQLLVISYGADLPKPGDTPSAEDSFLFMRQADGTWARVRTDGPPGGAASDEPPLPPAPGGAASAK